jgi:hypothetical protein
MAWLIISFVAGFATGMFSARYFFPEVRVKYKVVEKETYHCGDENHDNNDNTTPKRQAKRER